MTKTFEEELKMLPQKIEEIVRKADKEIQEAEAKLLFAEEEIDELNDKIGQLELQLKSPQPLPVVPECVAELIEWAKENGLSLKQIFVYDRYSDFPDADEWLGTNKEDGKGNKEHQDIFALAFITGKYQVEKPKLFYLKNKLTTSYLVLDTNTGYYEHWQEPDNSILAKQKGYKTSFTKQEIDGIQTGSYEIIEVEE